MNNTKPCMEITLTNTKPSIFESKIGGTGYIPHDGNFPTDSKGNQLRLLAQIECGKIQLDGFMKTGLLQFWVLNDDVTGIDWDDQTKQDGFRVIYYPEIDTTVTKEEIESKFVKNEFDDDDMLPVFRECGMSFEKSENEYVGEQELSDDDYDKIIGHKIGGYPYFTQNDPREYIENGDSYDFLLFQLDTDSIDGEDVVMWGDSGVGNFFINSERLKKQDFSDVLYNWDCC